MNIKELLDREVLLRNCEDEVCEERLDPIMVAKKYNDETIYRVGVAYDESPTPSKERRTSRLPGSDRTWLSLGVSKQLDTDMSIDIGYSHLFVKDAPINNEFESSVPTLAANLNGDYTASINIFSVQLNWQY
ncbi:MAG: outer membrane protein transport protein [Sulfurimonas sp.]